MHQTVRLVLGICSVYFTQDERSACGKLATWVVNIDDTLNSRNFQYFDFKKCLFSPLSFVVCVERNMARNGNVRETLCLIHNMDGVVQKRLF